MSEYSGSAKVRVVAAGVHGDQLVDGKPVGAAVAPKRSAYTCSTCHKLGHTRSRCPEKNAKWPKTVAPATAPKRKSDDAERHNRLLFAAASLDDEAYKLEQDAKELRGVAEKIRSLWKPPVRA